MIGLEDVVVDLGQRGGMDAVKIDAGRPVVTGVRLALGHDGILEDPVGRVCTHREIQRGGIAVTFCGHAAAEVVVHQRVAAAFQLDAVGARARVFGIGLLPNVDDVVEEVHAVAG